MSSKYDCGTGPSPHWPADCWCEECRPDSWRNMYGLDLERSAAELAGLKSALRTNAAIVRDPAVASLLTSLADRVPKEDSK